MQAKPDTFQAVAVGKNKLMQKNLSANISCDEVVKLLRY